MDKEQSIHSLNMLLKGEHMAASIYETYLDTVEDYKVADWLKFFQKNHQRHAMLLADRIEELGGEPREGTGLSGFVANTMVKAKTALGIEQQEILEKLLEGEEMGIAKGKEVIKGDLDKRSLNLASTILAADGEHLSQLHRIMSGSSNDI